MLLGTCAVGILKMVELCGRRRSEVPNRSRIRRRMCCELPRCVTPIAWRGAALARIQRARYSFTHLIWPKNVVAGGSRELPNAMHSPMAFRFIYTRTIKLRNDETFPGAACFHTFRPD